MLTFHPTKFQIKQENNYGIVVKKPKNTQKIQKIPNLKLFSLKKPIIITYKHRQELHSYQLHKKIP